MGCSRESIEGIRFGVGACNYRKILVAVGGLEPPTKGLIK
jgi:hypothetical protein